MKIYIYKGGLSIVKKSGVGSAVQHQEQMLKETGAPIATSWKEADVVHINTVFRIQCWQHGQPENREKR